MRTTLGILSIALAAVCTAHAADEQRQTASYLDLRAGWSQPAGLEVDETVGGTAYDWQGEAGRGQRGQAAVLYGFDRAGGFFGGAGLSLTRWSITPSGYRSGLAGFGRSTAESLSARLVEAEFQAGYALGMPLGRTLNLWCEAAPLLGVGMMTADTEAAGRVDSASAMATEYGARVGIYLEERHWLVGLTGTWSKVSADVDIDVGGGSTSALSLSGQGFRLGLEAGYRF